MSEPNEPSKPRTGAAAVYAFFALACAITWATDIPWMLAALRHEPPPPIAAIGGLGALGPTIAAVVVLKLRDEKARQIFGPWRAPAPWILVALFAPLAVHLVAALIEVALGGHPSRWFYPPNEPQFVVALVFFSLGEEFGWRGFAYPRLADLHGPVIGAAIVGVVWALWHFGMMFTADKGAPDALAMGWFIAELVPWSIAGAWLLERTNRSMAVAIALHAGAHLDNTNRAPETEVRLRVLRIAVIAAVAALAAWSLSRRRGGEGAVIAGENQ